MTYVVIEEQVIHAVVTETTVDVIVTPVQTSVTVAPGAPPLTVKEIDGTPSVSNVLEIRVSNGTMTDLGGGVVTITTGGGGGGGSDAYYRHVQSVAASTWTVVHNLEKRPAITVVDSGGDIWFGNVHYDSDNQVTISFGVAFGGEAYFS
jgi:hypothetical protein